MGVREGRLAAVQARLERVAATRDLSPVLEPDALVEAQRLLEVAGDEADGLQAINLVGWLHWYRHHCRLGSLVGPARPGPGRQPGRGRHVVGR